MRFCEILRGAFFPPYIFLKIFFARFARALSLSSSHLHVFRVPNCLREPLHSLGMHNRKNQQRSIEHIFVLTVNSSFTQSFLLSVLNFRYRFCFDWTFFINTRRLFFGVLPSEILSNFQVVHIIRWNRAQNYVKNGFDRFVVQSISSGSLDPLSKGEKSSDSTFGAMPLLLTLCLNSLERAAVSCSFLSK